MKVSSYKTVNISEPKRRYCHAYLFPKNESVVQNLMNRRARPIQEYKQLLLDVLCKEGITGVKPVWSQKCGCSCGCSPGFRLNGLCNFHKDFFIDVE